MKIFILIALAIILFGINVGFFNSISFFGAIPNLLFLMIIVCAFGDFNDTELFVLALFSGLMFDIYNSALMGTFIFGLLFLALILRMISRRFLFFQTRLKHIHIGLFFSQAFIYAFSYFYPYTIKTLFVNNNVILYDFYIQNFLIEYMYNLIIIFPVFFLMNYFSNWYNKYFIRAKVY